jgi:AraC family transcriptional regulator
VRSHGEAAIADYDQPVTELVLVLRGRATVQREASGGMQCGEAGPSALWLSPAGLRINRCRFLSGTDMQALHLYLAPGLFAFGEDLLHLCGFQDPLIEQIGLAILSEMRDETTAGSLLIDSLSRSLALRLIHSHSRPRCAQNRPGVTGGLDARRLARVTAFIEANLRGTLTVDDMANVAHLSAAHFARSFKVSTGQTPHQFVSMRRLCLARQLLLADVPIAEIARSLDFSSQASFTRAFQRAVGTSPGRYRITNAPRLDAGDDEAASVSGKRRLGPPRA